MKAPPRSSRSPGYGASPDSLFDGFDPAPQTPPEADQLAFCFDVPAPTQEVEGSGIDSWRAERAARMRLLARKAALPLEHAVEVTLLNGLVLRGLLRLETDSLWIEDDKEEQLVFEVDRVPFRIHEIESCIRVD